MVITLVIVAVILYLIISSHFRRYKDADEKTLRTMPEWAVLASSGTKGNAERMSYSLIIQAEATLVKMGILPKKALRNLMSSKPGISKLSFVAFIKEETFYLSSSDVQFLERSNETAQARTHLAQCIEMILLRRGQATVEKIADRACSENILNQ